ncbi:group I intron-associated PD-(D/E)XK endonuclease [Halosegnis marinus]|uniref:Group I intron-associated PD-(D/E)XK endonuclease n=1 Tax=Halosegnis marinus TaxID=3034023 RepID=A0ABD5ZP40_9EURY|nr:group I intron-associated PD-(D/E)XK endonuclease [Halosegnis sp. DT85]
MVDREAAFEALDGPHERGQASEALVKAAFLVRGVSVSTPEYDNEPYDLVVHLDGDFRRVQVKTAYRNKPGTVQFETVSTRRRGEGYDREGYRGRADLFAVYNPVLDEVYAVPVADAAEGKTEIRFEPTDNGQRAGIRWHEDYLLDAYLAGRDPSIR